MHNTKIRISAGFKILIFISALVGIVLQCGLFSDHPDFSVLTYFTLMSNMACALYYLPAAIVQLRRDTPLLPRAKGAMIMCISITGLVYQLLLSGRFEMQGTLLLSNTLLHIVVPVCSVLDWLIFDKKGYYTWKMPVYWLLAPAAYFAFVMVAVKLGAHLGPYGEKYPYFFMDVDTLGFGTVLGIALAMCACFYLLGLLLVLIDHRMARLSQRHAEDKC